MSPGEPLGDKVPGLFDLSGRRVLVVGAAHGLGLATATAFRAAGAEVAGMDYDAEPLQAVGDEHGFAAAVAADVDDTASVDAAVGQSVEALGGLDVIVNFAGRYPSAPLASADPEFMVDLFNTNVVGQVRVVRAAHEALIESSSPRVISISSITFFTAVPDGLGAYITTKASVIGYTRALARELGPHGVCVNAIAPGAIPTRAERVIEDRAAYDKQVIEAQCLKRRGSVEEIAGTVLFFSSDAGGFITGQTLLVDGGWSFN